MDNCRFLRQKKRSLLGKLSMFLLCLKGVRSDTQEERLG